MTDNILPFGLMAAPTVPARLSDPIDLGEFNPVYAGWKIVVDLSVELGANDMIAAALDDSTAMGDRNKAIEEWVAAFVVAWNFVDGQGALLPQPRDGGAARLRQELMQPVSQAVAKALNPKGN